MPKYLKYLDLHPSAFDDMVVLDVGSGPIMSGDCFYNSHMIGLDPLNEVYGAIGFPIYRPRQDTGFAEKMPYPDDFFDVVISVNAIDHVDDIDLVSKEIQRVLKPDGLMRMQIHYHPATVTEPLSFTDKYLKRVFSWDPKFKPISRSHKIMGYSCPPSEQYVLWSNF